jgi:hypothetical protein
MEIRPVGIELFHADGSTVERRRDGGTDITNLLQWGMLERKQLVLEPRSL